MNLRQPLLIVLLFSFAPSVADADLIFDFEDQQGVVGVVSLAYVKPDLTMTITRSSGATFDVDATGATGFFNGSLSPFNGIGGASIDDVFQFELSSPVAFITVDAGDFGGDADNLRLEAFTGAGLTGNSFVAQATLPGGGSNFGFVSMQLARSPLEAGFQSFTLRGGGTQFPNSVYYDNFAFRLSAVPEPSAGIFVLVASLLGMASLRFKEQLAQ
ncbi:MAG: hypothetical protein U0930_20105 [Pirellulales bacterium]